jgi:hypothetical protein
MAARSQPFDSIESAQAYVALLCEAVEDASRAIELEFASPSVPARPRHQDALRLVEYKLQNLQLHLTASRRQLTDLRSLRRYLLAERVLDRTHKPV